MPKDQRLSKGVQITYGSRRHTRKPTKQKTTTNKTLKQIEKEKEVHAYEISGKCTSFSSSNIPFIPHIFIVLSFTQWQQILYADQLTTNHDQDGDVTMGGPGDEYMGNDSDWEDEVQDGLCQLPPSEEGFLQSHAGGEAVLQAVMDGITLS